MTNERKNSGLFQGVKFFLDSVPAVLHEHFENVDGSLKQISERINDGAHEFLPINELKRFNNNLERLNSNIEGLKNSPFFQELGKFLWHINEFGLFIESKVRKLQESDSGSLNKSGRRF